LQVRAGPCPSLLGKPVQPGAESSGGRFGNYRPGGNARDVGQHTKCLWTPRHSSKKLGLCRPHCYLQFSIGMINY